MAKKAVSTVAPEARSYFLTYFLPATYTDAELAGFRDAVLGLITKHQGKVVTTEDWGKKRLAYKIKHAGKWHTEGVYTHLTISLTPDHAQALERDLLLQNNIIRHLLIKNDAKIKGEESTAE